MRASQQSNFISPSGTCAAFATGLRDGFTEEEVRSNALPHPGLLPKERRIALSFTGTRAAGSAGQSFPSQKAVLKTRAVQTLRDCRVSPNRAKRLECGASRRFSYRFLRLRCSLPCYGRHLRRLLSLPDRMLSATRLPRPPISVFSKSPMAARAYCGSRMMLP